MHIVEGFLPLSHAIAWYALSTPFLLKGMHNINRQIGKKAEKKLLLAASAAFAFLLSSLKLPSLTGSSSHPTGIGLGTILFKPSAMTVVATIVLLFQALLLAHGGISTLGANVFSLGIIGPWVSYLIYRLAIYLKLSVSKAVFISACLGNLSIYLTTSFQLALAFPDQKGGIIISLVKFSSIFAITQIPLAISEALLTVLIVNFLQTYNSEELRSLNFSLTKES